MASDAYPLARHLHRARCGGGLEGSLRADWRTPPHRVVDLLRVPDRAPRGVRRPSFQRARPRACSAPPLAIGIVYLLIFGALGLGGSLLLPRLGAQLGQFAEQAPAHLESARARALGWTKAYERYELPVGGGGGRGGRALGRPPARRPEKDLLSPGVRNPELRSGRGPGPSPCSVRASSVTGTAVFAGTNPDPAAWSTPW